MKLLWLAIRAGAGRDGWLKVTALPPEVEAYIAAQQGTVDAQIAMDRTLEAMECATDAFRDSLDANDAARAVYNEAKDKVAEWHPELYDAARKWTVGGDMDLRQAFELAAAELAEPQPS